MRMRSSRRSWRLLRFAVSLVVAVTMVASCGTDAEGPEPAAVIDTAPADSTPVDTAPTETVPTETVPTETVPTETVPTETVPTETVVIDTAPINTARFPVVIDVRAAQGDGANWRFDVTLSSPYDTPERYADAWRVLDADDNELGIRILGHDHANEQPFTRSTNVDIPGQITVVFVEGRDQQYGWSGQRFKVDLTG